MTTFERVQEIQARSDSMERFIGSKYSYLVMVDVGTQRIPVKAGPFLTPIETRQLADSLIVAAQVGEKWIATGEYDE